MPNIISLHDVLEPLKQALFATRDVIVSSQMCVSKLQRVFALGDGCWLPIAAKYHRNLQLATPICFSALCTLGADLSAPSPGDDLRLVSAIRLHGQSVRSDSFLEQEL